jgi:hypothetical protein
MFLRWSNRVTRWATREGPLTADALEVFVTSVCAGAQWDQPPQLVYRGDPAPRELVDHAQRQGVWVRSFREYQQVWYPSRYVERQTQELLADRGYPLDRYVDKHWAPLGRSSPGKARSPPRWRRGWTATSHGSS